MYKWILLLAGSVIGIIRKFGFWHSKNKINLENINLTTLLSFIKHQYFHQDGHYMLDDIFHIEGHYIVEADFINDRHRGANVLAAFNKFEWILSLLNLGTTNAAQKALDLINLWIEQHKNYNSLTLDKEILASRIFHWIIIYNFIVTNTYNKQYHTKIHNSLSKQISYFMLINMFVNVYDSILVHKAILICHIITTNTKKSKAKLYKTIKLINITIRNNILSDGCHISRNPQETLMYLKHLLHIYNIIIDNKIDIDTTTIREYIDKIATFIRTMRHTNGTLAVFNKSFDVDKILIDFLLSASNISSKTFTYLRYSGYVKLATPHCSVIMDFGSQDTFLSTEICTKKDKIITNGSTPMTKDINNLITPPPHSCLILKNKKGLIRPDPKKLTNQQIRVSTDDTWETVNIKCEAIHHRKIIYRRTLYNNKHKFYVIGEDLITIQHNDHDEIEALLCFHLHPDIKDVKYEQQDNTLLCFSNNGVYAIHAVNNQIKVSQSYHFAQLGHYIHSKSFYIKFNVNDHTIKNEWHIRRLSPST